MYLYTKKLGNQKSYTKYELLYMDEP